MPTIKNPEYVFELTNKCAYHCTICPRELMTRDQGVMTMDLFEKIINEGIDHGLKHVSLIGFGEPMLDKFFVERVKLCKSKNLIVSTDTTGYLLKEDISKELIDLQIDDIRFSCFATTKEIYYKLHNLNTFDLAYARINKFLELKKKKGTKLPVTSIYFVEQELNKHQTQDFINYWEGRVDFVNVWAAHNWIDSYEFRNKNFKRKKTCGRPANGPLQIRWDGKVSACCFDFNTQLVVGDCTKNSLTEIENSKENLKLIEAHNNGDFSDYSICNNCDQMYETPTTLIYTNDPQNKVGVSGTTKRQFEIETS